MPVVGRRGESKRNHLSHSILLRCKKLPFLAFLAFLAFSFEMIAARSAALSLGLSSSDPEFPPVTKRQSEAVRRTLSVQKQIVSKFRGNPFDDTTCSGLIGPVTQPAVG